jgi:uncharacterized membrane protein YjjB (DUF3815 family)
MGIISYLFALLQDMALAAIPAAGFAMVFNVPQRALRWCAAGRDRPRFAHGDDDAGFNIEWATFLAALLVGSIGIQWSRWYLAHPKIFTVAAVIPMFPGISAYTAMISAVKISHFGYSEEMMIMLLSNFSRPPPSLAPSLSVFPFRVSGCTVSARGYSRDLARRCATIANGFQFALLRQRDPDAACQRVGCPVSKAPENDRYPGRLPLSLLFRVEIVLCLREY